MSTVAVSPKYQIVILKAICEALRLQPSQRLQVIQDENRIEFIIDKEIGALKGFLLGINADFQRENDRV